MRAALFQKFKREDVGSSHPEMFSRSRCSFKPILDSDNKLMEGNKNLCKLLED